MLLESLGADSEVFGHFQPFCARGLVLARVAISHRDEYHLIAESGEVSAQPSGGLWHRAPDRASMPVVGDWVAARIVGPGEAIVEAVLPRRTFFSRRAAGSREDQQPIAANIDLLFLVCGLDGDFNVRRIERYLALAAESRARPVIVLNKADVCTDLSARREQVEAVAGRAPIVTCSAQHATGLDGLTVYLAPGRTVALLGSSGVGKSTIVNCLLGDERLRTAEVRASDSRGRHTTTHRELLPLPGGGALIDTPGMRELQLWAGSETVSRSFEDIAELAASCRFRNCSHAGEPGCAVVGAIDAARMESYRKLLAEARHHEVMTDVKAAQEQKRKWKRIHQAMKQHYKLKR